MERQISQSGGANAGFVTWLSDKKGIKITNVEFPKFLNTLVYKHTTFNDIFEVWNKNMQELNNSINKEQEKVDSWEEQLTLKEKQETKKKEPVKKEKEPVDVGNIAMKIFMESMK